MFILSRRYGKGLESVRYRYIYIYIYLKLPQTPTLISFECDSCRVKCFSLLCLKKSGVLDSGLSGAASSLCREAAAVSEPL